MELRSKSLFFVDGSQLCGFYAENTQSLTDVIKYPQKDLKRLTRVMSLI